MIAGATMITLSSCGKVKGLDDNQAEIMSSAVETGNVAGEVQETRNEDVASTGNTDSTESFTEKGQAATEEAEADLYEGEYSDYDTKEPALEIKRNNDGTYQIQIEIYRLFYFDDGVGKATEEGIEFAATGPSGNEINGVIKLEEDIATVTFFSQEWADFAGLSEYKFYKTSEVPNI